MTTTQSLTEYKVAATNKAAALAFVAVLAISGAVPMQAQTISSAEARANVEERVVSEADPCKNVATIVDPAAHFSQLVQQWRTEKGARSLYSQLAILPSYQSILAMGPNAIPFILAQLKSEGNTPESAWFWALAALTHDNPVPPNSRGKILEMAKAWLEWGQSKGYVQMV